MHRFVRDRQPGQVMDRGLWAWSRHPNYFGELGFWFGLALFGVAASPGDWWWVFVGARGDARDVPGREHPDDGGAQPRAPAGYQDGHRPGAALRAAPAARRAARDDRASSSRGSATAGCSPRSTSRTRRRRRHLRQAGARVSGQELGMRLARPDGLGAGLRPCRSGSVGWTRSRRSGPPSTASGRSARTRSATPCRAALSRHRASARSLTSTASTAPPARPGPGRPRSGRSRSRDRRSAAPAGRHRRLAEQDRGAEVEAVSGEHAVGRQQLHLPAEQPGGDGSPSLGPARLVAEVVLAHGPSISRAAPAVRAARHPVSQLVVGGVAAPLPG